MKKSREKRYTVQGLLGRIQELETEVGTLRLDTRYDKLTGLPNQTHFTERFRLELASARRHKEQVMLHMIDLNKFKKLNDTHGHEVADKILVAMAVRFRELIRRGNDVIARRSGDEFWALVSGIKETSYPLKFAEMITEAFREPLIIEKKRIRVSVSIGVRVVNPATESGIDFSVLMKDADIAMYEAKRKGKPYHLYEEK